MSAKVSIKSVTEINGRITDRLNVNVDGDDLCSVIISNPMTIDCVIEKLELLAWKLRRINRLYDLDER